MSHDFNTHTRIEVINAFDAAADLQLFHQYSTGAPHSARWRAVAPGEGARPVWQIGYDTGWLHPGQDHWWAMAVVTSGDHEGVWRAEKFTCILHSKDADKVLRCTFGPDGVKLDSSADRAAAPIARVVPGG